MSMRPPKKTTEPQETVTEDEDRKLKEAIAAADKEFEKEMENGNGNKRMSTNTHVRGEVLMEAGKLITGDRADAYGNYKDQMQSIADMFNAMYNGIVDAPTLKAEHVSNILILLKMRRKITSNDIDSRVDMCGYTALDAEYFKPNA